MGLVLAAYAATALVVPTMANVAVTDDWVYYRTVETLLFEHQLRVHDMSSAALIFQTAWGALFGAVFGFSFGTLRLSTLVMVGAGGLAVYGLARELGVPRSWSALGMLAYLFHPLALPLAYSFMTDPHFTSLLAISAWLYVRALRREPGSARLLLAGSAAASGALLVRQQGVAIPLAIAGTLLVERRLTVSWSGVRLLLLTGGLPVVTFVLYTVWLRAGQGVPWALELFSAELAAAGWRGVADLLPRLAVIEAVYIGLFVLPLGVATLASARWWWPGWRASVAAGAWAALVVIGSLVLAAQGRTMPYVGQFLTTTGLGPEDVIAARPLLLDLPVRQALTAACVLASLVWGLSLARRLALRRGPFGIAYRLVLGLTIAQAVAAIPASIHFAVWGGTLDRYLLPLLPLSILLLLGATAGLQRRGTWWLAVAGLLGMSAFSVAGTRDHLAFLDSVWSLAREANALGVPDTRLDAGAGWDGLHLYSGPPSPARPPRTPHPPWWIDLWAPLTDSAYVVAGAQLPGYVPLGERAYSSWLRREQLTVYLLRRADVDGPP